MIDAVRFMSQEIGLPLPEVIRMASTNPAQRLHLQNHIGSIAPKMQADLVCFDRHFKVQYTWKKGRLVFQR
jgi:N-acetylglucosamine-6-phosphate deacetylase